MSPFFTRVMKPSAWLASAVLLCACAGGPKPPDWQVEAKGSVERSVGAYLAGDSRVEAAELARARSQLSRTGRADLLATAELLHCAARVASLVFETCAGFEPLRADATPAQTAYAEYLQGRLVAENIALLPPAQRAVAGGDAASLKAIIDPLAQLVAAGVLLQTRQASPLVIAQAVDTASAQGWRRPLLAWLGVQARHAEEGGDMQEANRVRRRMAIAQGAGLRLQQPEKDPP